MPSRFHADSPAGPTWRRALDGRTHLSSLVNSFSSPVGRGNTYARACPVLTPFVAPHFPFLFFFAAAAAPRRRSRRSQFPEWWCPYVACISFARERCFRAIVSPLGDLASDSVASQLCRASLRLRSGRTGGALTPVRVSSARQELCLKGCGCRQPSQRRRRVYPLS